MSQSQANPGRHAKGFSLIELLTVLAILTLVMGVVFNEIIRVQQRYRTEETKIDMFQQARELLDQFVRDVHQAGYPNIKMYQAGVLINPRENDARNAAGLVSVSATDVRFEGDMDGDGQVDSVSYALTKGPDGNCPCSVLRSQVIKVNATSPLTQATNYNTAVTNVVNSGGALTISGNSTFPGSGGTVTTVANNTLYAEYRNAPLFAAFDRNGNAVALPVTIASNPTAISSIKSIRITLNVLGTIPDPQTLMRPAVSLTASARINN
ncbi:MAG: PilW family protein [Terriglobales bacterium]